MQNKLEPIFQEITKPIEGKKDNSFAVFDFDNTCIVNDITEATLNFMARNDLFKDKNLSENRDGDYSKSVFEHYYKLLDDGKTKEAYEFSAKILGGFFAGGINSLVADVIKFEGEKINTAELWDRKIAKGIKPRKQVIELINFLKRNNVQVWIISASPEILVREAMKHFNIDVNLIGVRNFIVDGKITPKLKEPTSIIEGKVVCIKKFINQETRPIIGIGDSINDLPMLEYCDIKVVVDRRNALSEKAKQNNWFII